MALEKHNYRVAIVFQGISQSINLYLYSILLKNSYNFASHGLWRGKLERIPFHPTCNTSSRHWKEGRKDISILAIPPLLTYFVNNITL